MANAENERIARLADYLEADGSLTQPRWRDTLLAVPRHLFAPNVAWASPDGSHDDVLINRLIEPDGWWDAVYSDTVLITQLDDGNTDIGADEGVPTSSCSPPGAVIDTLERLRVADGHRVLDIGTGTGWTAALLSHRVGDRQVTSIEVDPTVAAHAAKNLAEAGYHPNLVVGDGADGVPSHAPYDRVHATCSVRRIPYAWVQQTRPGGIIVTPFRLGYGYGHLLRLHVVDGCAHGRFMANAGYMLLRGQRLQPVLGDPGEQVASTTRIDPRTVVWDDYGADLAIGAHVPDCAETLQDGDDGSATLRLTHPDGSRAEVEYRPGQVDYLVRQAGPRRLWDDVVGSYLWWLRVGRPDRERFGMTVTRDRQWIWLDDPDGPHVWELP